MTAPALLLVMVTGCLGQAASQPSPTSAIELADPYVDGSYGISLQPPKGWGLIRQQVPESRGITILRMVDRVSPSRIQEMVLKRTSTTKPLGLKETLERLAASLQLEFNDVTILSQQLQTIAGKPGAVLSATLSSEGVKQLRMEAIIEIGPQQYFVLLYSGPAELRQKSESLFYVVLDSVRLLIGEDDEAALAAAGEAATEWLARIKPEDLEKALQGEQFLQVSLNDQVVGMVIVEQALHTWKSRPGVRVRERGWIFEENGQARHLQSTMFVSNDLRHERWRTTITTLLPADAQNPERIEKEQEEGLREGNALLSSQTYHLGEPSKDNAPLRLPKNYISRALMRLLPRLMDDLSKPRKFTFTTFDHQRQALVLHVVELKGAAQTPAGKSEQLAFRIEEREGFAADPTSRLVDQSGSLLMMKAGQLSLRPASREELEKRFSDRVKASEEKTSRLEEQFEKSMERFRPKRP
jgi:hypothetical protein